MKAIVQHGYGDTDVLTFSDIPTPAIGPREVLIQVRAAAVDAGVWHLMTGTPYVLRLGFGLSRPRKRIRGMDVSGLVEAVGKDVTDFQPGDEVFGTCDGSFAEYATAHHTKLTRKPRNLTHQQAAAIPISAFTALAALRDKGQVTAGQRVLVIGAGGGVGSYAVQLGKVFGAHVTGLCSTSKVEFVRGLGADEVLDYTKDDFTRHEYDLILDIAGNRPINHVRGALSASGTLVIVGGEQGKVIGAVSGLVRATVMNLFTGHTLRGLISLANHEDLVELRDMAEAGKFVPAVDREYPLSEVPGAIAHARAGRARGKVVITV